MTISRVLLFCLIFLILGFREVSAQRGKQPTQMPYSAILTDEAGQPIARALISGREGAVETRTDQQGRFTLKVPAGGLVHIQADGYETQLIDVVNLTETIVLKKSGFLEDDASQITIPFGQTTRRAIVGATTAIMPSDFLKYDNVQSFYDILSGRVPGLLGTTNIRGIGDAVFIVDGVPRDPSTLNAEEIAQITVLKDANAAVLYGVHATNGVILVTTKRGQPYQRKFNVVAEQGVSAPVALPSYLNSAEYMRLYNEARANDGLTPAFDDATIQNYSSGKNGYQYPNVDYYSSEFLARRRPTTKVLSEFSGGNKTTQYYAHLGWVNAGTLYRIGDAAHTSSNRFNVRSNINVNVNEFIKTYFDAVAVFTINKSPAGDFWNDAATLHPYRYSPLLPLALLKNNVSLPDGVSLDNARIINGGYLLGGTSLFTNNVYGNQSIGGYSTLIQRTAQFNQGIQIDLNRFVQGLRFKTVVGLDLRNDYVQSVTNQYAVYQPTWQTSANGVDSIAALTKIGVDLRTGVQNLGSLDFSRRLGVQAFFDYERTFKQIHSVTGTLLGYFDQFNFQNILIPQRHAHLGLRLTYDYKKKYFANLSSAYVNGYKLAPGHKGGFSPSLGLGWVLSEEGFLAGNSIVDYLKVRFSAGIVNNEFGGTDYRQYDQTFGTYKGSFSWDDGIRSLPTVTLQRAANPDLSFEKMKTLNLGFESYLFHKSLYVDVNLFTTRNSGQVVQRSIYPGYLYTNIPYENYNETGYKGIEAGINWLKTRNEFTVSFGVNALYSTSKVIKRDEIWLYDYLYRKGGPNDAIYGLESLGYFASTDDIAKSPAQQFGEVQPGDIKYKDQNNDGKVDANDMVRIGNAQSRLAYGLTAQIKYRNVSLFVIGNGRMGGYDAYDGNYFWVQGDAKYSTEVLNRWTPATAATATYPRLSAGNNSNNFRTSTHWLYRNDYFTLSRVQLTYELPSPLANRLFSKGFSVYLRGENLLRLSDDAERRQLRIGTEPLYRNYAIGARVMF